MIGNREVHANVFLDENHVTAFLSIKAPSEFLEGAPRMSATDYR